MKTDTKAFDQAEKEVKEKIAKLLSIGGKQSVDDIHKKLGHIMWENVGMARTKESLEKRSPRSRLCARSSGRT